MSYTKTTWVDNQPPYLNAENLNKIENQLEINTSDITANTSAIEANTSTLTGLVGLQGEVLWTNANPTSDFASQTITLDKSLDSYNCYEIYFRQSKTTSRYFTTGKIPVGYGTILEVYGANYRPTGTTMSGNTIYFENASVSGATDNGYAIPIYVIGYKTGIF